MKTKSCDRCTHMVVLLPNRGLQNVIFNYWSQMECKHNEQKELLFCKRVEDRLDSKGTKANPKFVYLRCAGNGCQRDGIGWTTKWIVGLTAPGERWSGVGEPVNSTANWIYVGERVEW